MRQFFSLKNILPIFLFVMIWLMTGISEDDEFSGEYQVFLKHQPSAQFYFSSPLGMQDMPKDYPQKLREKQAIYDEFVLKKHWSSDLSWITEILIFILAAILSFRIFVLLKEIYKNSFSTKKFNNSEF